MQIQRSLVGVAAALALMPLVQTQILPAQDEDPPQRVARIAEVSGNVSLLNPGDQNWSEAPPNYPMIGGARLYTGDDGRAAIQNGTIDVRVWRDTDVTLTNLTDNYQQLGLAQGSVRVRVYSLMQDGMVEVDTPNGAVIVQQPGDYRVNVYPGQSGSVVQVNVGTAAITGPGLNQEVDQGQAVQLWGANPVQIGLVEMPPYDDLDNWSIDRDRHIMNSVSARYVSRDMPGYDDLDDNGSWNQEADYGPVWYPQNTPAGWAPYTFGHWAYVAPWGWTWVDDASWGYAPFHYGRWAVIRGRWGWVPGPPAVAPVYSPALVAFVGGGPGFTVGSGFGGGGVAAWFPIGVGEPFVPWYHCSPGYVRTVNVTNVNVTYIRNTTVVNNYNTFINNTRTVNNVNQIRVNNVQFANRGNVVAVPANAMGTGARIQHAQVRLEPQQRRQLAQAPVAIARPPMAAPQRPILPARANVPRPVQAPRLLTPHGAVAATPAANTTRFNPAAMPRPQPAAAIRPATKTIAPNLRPANPGQPAMGGQPPAGAPANRPNQPGAGNRPGQMPGQIPAQGNQPGQVPGQQNRPQPMPGVVNRQAPPPQQQRPQMGQPPQPQPQPNPPPAYRGNPNPPQGQPAQPPTRQYAQPPAQPPPQPRPAPQPEMRPQPQQPQPQERPQQRPAPPPPARPAPPPPQQRQATPPPQQGGQRPQPEKKPDEKKPQ